MNNELDTLSCRHTDLEESGRLSGTDEHGEVVEVEYSDRVAISMQHVFVGDPMLACALEDDGVHPHQLTLTRSSCHARLQNRLPPSGLG